MSGLRHRSLSSAMLPPQSPRANALNSVELDLGDFLQSEHLDSFEVAQIQRQIEKQITQTLAEYKSRKRGETKLSQSAPEGHTIPPLSLLPESKVDTQHNTPTVSHKRVTTPEPHDRVLESKERPFRLSDITDHIVDGMQVVVTDDFSKCFRTHPVAAWDWNVYLWVLRLVGLLLRYCILLPIRIVSLLLGVVLFVLGFVLVKLLFKGGQVGGRADKGFRGVLNRQRAERWLIRFLCSAFVFSWTGVIKYHGTLPAAKTNRIFVANHTSMIDMIILQQMFTFSLVGQQHKGWVGFIQKQVLSCLGCVWFDRKAKKDRSAAGTAIRQHLRTPGANRLLLFPEGTCVNNRYCVMFKGGAFSMGAEVCPIALKYNSLFADAFWNSRKQSFLQHLLNLMSSWCVVCDVHFLPPMQMQQDESHIDFANRVKARIAKKAGLINVHWDGYLKHFRPSDRYVRHKQKVIAESLQSKIEALRLQQQEQSLPKTTVKVKLKV